MSLRNLEEGKREKGFTLIEVVVVIAVVAILAAILTPSIVKSIEDAKISRAKNEVIVLTAAFASFYKDIGTKRLFPDAAGNPDTYEVIFSEGNLSGDNETVNFPGTRETLKNHFGGNGAETAPGIFDNRYDAAYGIGRWKGPYSKKIVESDPWNRRYIIYVEDNAGLYSWAISAGPDGAFATNRNNNTIQGDDIGKMIMKLGS